MCKFKKTQRTRRHSVLSASPLCSLRFVKSCIWQLKKHRGHGEGTDITEMFCVPVFSAICKKLHMASLIQPSFLNKLQKGEMYDPF